MPLLEQGLVPQISLLMEDTLLHVELFDELHWPGRFLKSSQERIWLADLRKHFADELFIRNLADNRMGGSKEALLRLLVVAGALNPDSRDYQYDVDRIQEFN